MSKVIKLLISIFVGLDVFVACYFGLANLRVAMFGQGSIPGGGSAIDMAVFLIPLFIGYVAGDRLFYFLTYKERLETRRQKAAETLQAAKENPTTDSIWEDADWDDAAVTNNTRSESEGSAQTLKN